MLNYDIAKLPPSYVYSDILDTIRAGQVAYCYMGDKEGTFLFRDKDNSILMILDYRKETSGNYSHELWTYVHKIPNGNLRQDVVNKLYELVNNYYGYINLSDYKLKIQ